ncbi:MAG: hypothetical protein RLZZ303_3166 [Candidatus Hydrogenedentota bacterium]|jgi:DNA-binding transcriptional MerR regulator/methylmalonyl-CoA mutase cobalamin-binding subunit
MSYQDPRHNMQVVVRRTGLSPHVIRVWEKRYGAVEPGRTDTNRRLYSDADIDRLRLLGAATRLGHAIGTIAGLSIPELEALQKDAASDSLALGTSSLPEENASLARLSAAAREAIQHFDDSGLAETLRAANAELARPLLMDSFLLPLLDWLGRCWQSGKLRVAHEHFASVIIRDFLITIRGNYAEQESAPVMVVATPSGQHHELGALIVADTASSAGWHVVYMGAALPAEDVGLIARETGAAAVALSIVYPPDDPALARELRELARSYLPAGVSLLVGGMGAAAYGDVIDDIGAHRIQSMAELRTLLDTLRQGHARRVQAAARP